MYIYIYVHIYIYIYIHIYVVPNFSDNIVRSHMHEATLHGTDTAFTRKFRL